MKNLKSWLIIGISIVFVLVVDLTTKHFLFSIDYFNLIPNFISIASNGGNTGAAFGMFSGNTAGLVLLSVIIIVALFVFNQFVKRKNAFYSLAFGFIVGGALGNMFDRIVLGYVRDFIYLDFWPSYPTFNFADAFLVVGAVMLAIFVIFMSEKKNGRESRNS